MSYKIPIGEITTIALTSTGDSTIRPASGITVKLLAYGGGGNADVGISITDGTDACKITGQYSGSQNYSGAVVGDSASSSTLTSAVPAWYLTNDLWLTLSGTTSANFYYVAYQVIDE